MTRVLVVYGTTDGQTRKVALHLGIALHDAGVDADVLMASSAAVSPEGYAGVIVAASLHAGQYQRNVRDWLRRHAPALRGKTTAFVSVCMMARDSRPETARRLRTMMRDFADAQGWTPNQLKPVAGALAYTRYGWLKRWMVKRMAVRNGGPADTTRDHEFTDWDDLRAFGEQFARRIRIQHGELIPSVA